MSACLNKNKFLSKDELKRLEKTLDSYIFDEPRDTSMLFTMIYTGARPTECLRIRKMDLNSENNTIFIQGLKGSRDREIPVPEWLFTKLEDLSEKSQPADPVFSVALRTMQGIWARYRPVQGKGIRSLRHTFAIRLYEKTKDVRLVQMALGHRYLNTTQIYVDYIYNQEELKRLLL